MTATARSVTYADLDTLLRRLGFVSRQKNISRPVVDAYGTAPKDGNVVLMTAARPAVVYREPESDTLIILPQRPLDAPVQPQHLIPTRRLLIEKGLIEDVDFERWLCAMRFGEVCRDEAASNGTSTVSRARVGRTRTG